MNLLSILFASIFVNNIILSLFLGCCPFLGVSSRIMSARGMGFAVVFVMVMASAITWVVYHAILVPLGFRYLYTLSFILVIAALVQLVEMVLKKVNPPLYKALGIFLPLITTNCAVLGIAVINMNRNYGFLESVTNAFGASLGFFLALYLMAGIRERLDLSETMPAFMRGLPIALVTASLMALAFMGFVGIM